MKSKSQDILCACFDITKTEVRNFLSKEDANIEDLYSNLKVGSKCTACLADLDLLLSESQNIDSPYEEREQTLSENFGLISTVLSKQVSDILFPPHSKVVPDDTDSLTHSRTLSTSDGRINGPISVLLSKGFPIFNGFKFIEPTQ